MVRCYAPVPDCRPRSSKYTPATDRDESEGRRRGFNLVLLGFHPSAAAVQRRQSAVVRSFHRLTMLEPRVFFAYQISVVPVPRTHEHPPTNRLTTPWNGLDIFFIASDAPRRALFTEASKLFTS
jgi:hypothetical protein